MKLECKGGPHDGLVVEVVGFEYRVYGKTRNGRFNEWVYRYALEGDGEKWTEFLEFFATDTFDAESGERIERKLSFAV